MENNQKKLKFPNNFLWGTSTSAYQVEGGIKNDWSEWEKRRVESRKFKSRKLNKEDFICGYACDSYNRYKEDIELAKKFNTNAMRIGIEWARIQPKKDEWNIDAINHYKKVLSEIKNQGMTTVCTLWHWTNPIWVAEENGWENKKTVDYFIKYTELIVKELGEFIDYWVVLNEPMVHIANGYISGKFPPNKKNILSRMAKSVEHRCNQKLFNIVTPDIALSICSDNSVSDKIYNQKTFSANNRVIAFLNGVLFNKEDLAKHLNLKKHESSMLKSSLLVKQLYKNYKNKFIHSKYYK